MKLLYRILSLLLLLVAVPVRCETSDYVYNDAGKPGASAVSNWGLRNGYISGEWWRVRCNWWEICLYDRKNRYNDSWRIRPIYVINYNSGIMQRVPGGSAHWLFRKMVLHDIWYTLTHLF